MNIEEFREFCLSKKGTTEEFPFDEDVLVFKVRGKMFALTNVQRFQSISLKCDPELATNLREQYPAVTAGYHLNKKHWNSVLMNGSVPGEMIRNWIDHSYDLVVKALPKATRMDLED